MSESGGRVLLKSSKFYAALVEDVFVPLTAAARVRSVPNAVFPSSQRSVRLQVVMPISIPNQVVDGHFLSDVSVLGRLPIPIAVKGSYVLGSQGLSSQIKSF